MSVADYRRNIFLLIILINVKQFCNGHPGGGAIVFPSDRDDYKKNPIIPYVKSGAQVESRLGTLLPAGSHTATSRDIEHDVNLSIPKSSMLKSMITTPVSKTGKIIASTPKNSATVKASIPKGNATVNKDTDEDEYRPRFTTKARLNCICKIGDRCAETEDC